MFCSFHFFTFFLKKRSIFSVFLRSFQKNVPFFFWYIYLYISIYISIYISKKERNVLKFFCKKTKRYILRVLFRSKKRTLRSFPFFSRVFGNLWDPKERYVLSRSFGKNVTFFPSFSVHLKRMGWRGSYILRYKKCCFEIWEALCWGECRGSYISRYGRSCFEILPGLFRDMGGVEICFWEAGIQIL